MELAYNIDSISLNQLSVLYYLSFVGTLVSALVLGVDEAVANPNDIMGYESW